MNNLLLKSLFFINIFALVITGVFFHSVFPLLLLTLNITFPLYLLAKYEPTEEQIQHNINSPNVGW